MNSNNSNKRDRASRLTRLCAFLLTVGVLVFPLLYGCKKKSAPVPAQTAAPIPEQVPEAEAVVPVEEEKEEKEPYMYSRANRRDPFKPLIAVAVTPAGEIKRPTGTLESYDISDFEVLAIAKKGDQFFALLQSQDNKSFSVQEGATIGLNDGKITAITLDKVVTSEEYIDPFGKTKTRQIILELHKGEE